MAQSNTAQASGTQASAKTAAPYHIHMKVAGPKPEWGTFIEPDTRLHEQEDIVGPLGLKVFSGYQAVKYMQDFLGKSPLFDQVVSNIDLVKMPYEDQCSANYYYDLFQVLQALRGKYDRVAEVGVFMGGASVILAGCIEEFDFDLDLIDIDPRCLLFTYERIRRTHPGAEKRVRLFWGGLPEYTQHVLSNYGGRAVVHHDGCHYFEPVVRDLASLYFARQAVHALICQDTHLRGRSQKLNFVDMALYAVFGLQMEYTPIGTYYHPHDDLMTNPNQFEGNYFLANQPEGMALLLEENEFRYPHPNMELREFLGKPPEWLTIE